MAEKIFEDPGRGSIVQVYEGEKDGGPLAR